MCPDAGVRSHLRFFNCCTYTTNTNTHLNSISKHLIGKKLKHLTESGVGKHTEQREFIYTAGGSINRNNHLGK